MFPADENLLTKKMLGEFPFFTSAAARATEWILGLVALGVLAVLCERLFRRQAAPCKTLLCYKESDFTRHVLSQCPLLTSYRPSFLAFNGHIHTIVAGYLPCKPVKFARELFGLRDGGQLALDWVVPTASLAPSSPVLIVLPGLTGAADTVSCICHEADRRGFRVVVFNKRGHGDTPLKTPKLQGFGDPEDLREVIESLQARYLDAKLVAVGSSAGSGLLASYCGEYGNAAILKGGVCISPGYDALELFMDRLPKLYEKLLLRGLKHIVRQHSHVISSRLDMKSVARAQSFRDFDEQVYCKMYGYKDAPEYWRHNNPMRNINNVSVPFMCINSLDDPICLKELVPFDFFKRKDHCLLVATDKGGHCAFMERLYHGSWADRASLQFLEAVLDFETHQKMD